MTWVQGAVTVEVPATSANLGPGYDCLGLALELADTLEAEVVERGLVVEVSGQGAAEVPRDESHLVVRSMVVALTAMGLELPGLRLRCTNRIPHSRGMGSSSAAIVGGLVLARALVRDGAERCDDAVLLSLANRIEGHPDNVAPALFGGLVVAGQSGEQVWAQQVPLFPGVRGVVLVPPYGVRTEAARDLLPARVPHAEAAANTGRAALAVAALGSAEVTRETLWLATEDFLHQRYREPAMPETLALVSALRADGVPAVVSGAGPTVLALAVEGPTASAQDQVQALLEAAPDGWWAREQRLGGPGARVLA
jgi:homoserine kinase